MGPLAIFFGNMEHPRKEALLCSPNCKIKINVQLWIIVYIKGNGTWGKA
jgi:hypothetical protein